MLGPVLALTHITGRLRKIRTLLNPERLARVADIVRGAWASELERQADGRVAGAGSRGGEGWNRRQPMMR